jgi:CO dehydrogenase/acetyl-CoA synthase beta subunit
MNLFDETIADLRSYIDQKKSGIYSESQIPLGSEWPAAGKGSVVLGPDTAIELGSPRDESVSFMLWSGDKSKIHDGRMTVIGPDLTETEQKNLPFGKVVILELNGMNGDNCYERHRELEMARYDLKLYGYMMRAVSQYGREWSRISRDAVNRGFSFAVLAGALDELYRKIDYVKSVEILFVTSSPSDVRELEVLGGRASRLIGALNKMASEMSFECGTCDYVDVCSEVEDLRNIRNTLTKEEKHVQP